MRKCFLYEFVNYAFELYSYVNSVVSGNFDRINYLRLETECIIKGDPVSDLCNCTIEFKRTFLNFWRSKGRIVLVFSTKKGDADRFPLARVYFNRNLIFRR
ncbi:MAG: hypothetical protein ACI4NE_08070 [Succinivibrio sp.]